MQAVAATATLEDTIDAQPMTAARTLTGSVDDIARGREAWIVDKVLLAQARTQNARLVLVGDVDQPGSVVAGRAFGQFQDHGMATFRLEEIVRQSNPETRKAVEAMLDGNAEEAFEALDAGGGRVVEQPDAQTRQAVLARDFATLFRESEPRRSCSTPPARAGRN